MGSGLVELVTKSSLRQSLVCVLYFMWAQWRSSLALNAFSDGASTTVDGRAFQSLTTRTLNAFRRTRVAALGLESFHWCPLVLVIVARSKNWEASTSSPPRSSW